MTPRPAAPARLEQPLRVRFDECGADGTARTSSFLRYAQDVAWAHSEAAGFDRAWYSAHGLTWLVRCLELDLTGPAESGAALVASTEVVGWRRVWVRRHSELRTGGGLLATIRTDWVLLGPSGAPVRIPPAIQTAFPTGLPAFEPGRVALPETPADAIVSRLQVRRHELDPLGHVNHAVYVDWLEEAIAGGGGPDALAALPRRVRLEYLRSAEAEQRVTVAVWRLGDGDRGAGWACRMTDAEGRELLRGELLAGELLG